MLSPVCLYHYIMAYLGMEGLIKLVLNQGLGKLIEESQEQFREERSLLKHMEGTLGSPPAQSAS